MPTALLSPLLLAAENATALTMRELDWPESPTGWLILLGGTALVIWWVIWQYRRDAVELHLGWKIWLIALRLAALCGLLVIALNPQDRTQKTSVRPSRVAVLVDTSLSMRHPATSAQGTTTVGPTRMEAIRVLLERDRLIERLRAEHEVSLFTFDAGLTGPHKVWPVATTQTSTEPAAANALAMNEWLTPLEPKGVETRLGEALEELIRQTAGRTLSGIVVLTDGGQNAGVDAVTAHDRAVSAKSRLLAVGVGGTDQPLNVQIADVQHPTDVQLGDQFELTAFLQAQGLSGQTIHVELQGSPGADAAAAIALGEQDVTVPADGAAAEVKFSLKPAEGGAWKYKLIARAPGGVVEFNDQDNQQTINVNVFDRPTKVLLFAGGPMWDYQFVRNLLHRHKSFDLDVLLQTASVGSSQDADNLLLDFPKDCEELYQYDVVIAFDPDWRLVPGEVVAMLRDWVYQEGGGLILVAGDVNTVQLAAIGEQPTPLQEQLAPLRELYPVVLNSYVSELRFEQESSQPWPLEFTPEGQRAEFLQLTDDAVTSAGRWKEFAGFYRCYPTAGAKAGATVLSRFSDPRSQNEFGFPILLAEQFYGQGRSLYLGSPEIWRLRAASDADYDRLWIKTLREVGQGRSKRGTRRGVLLPESRKLLLGQTARLRARLLDGQFQPLTVDAVNIEVYDPTGKPLVPTPRLTHDESRPGEYVGGFRASLPGTYRLDLELSDSRDRLTEEISVALPKLEDQDVRQNVSLLQNLVRDTGGEYLPIDQAAERLPGLLPSRAEPFTIDERLRSLWDRDWVLILLVTLLGAEWLTRKLLKLA